MAPWRPAVAHTDRVLLIVPADPLCGRRADEHFAAEAAAARDAGHDVALVDHDALAEPDGAGRAVARVPDGGGTAVYRGWMLASDRYAAFAAAWKVATRFLALRADGTWRVIELGDGQVSDRPASTEPAKFLSAALTA